MGPGRLGWPPAPKLGPPPSRPPGESGLDSPFFDATGASKDFGVGEVGMGGRGGGVVHLDKPLRVGGGGGS